MEHLSFTSFWSFWSASSILFGTTQSSTDQALTVSLPSNAVFGLRDDVSRHLYHRGASEFHKPSPFTRLFRELRRKHRCVPPFRSLLKGATPHLLSMGYLGLANDHATLAASGRPGLVKGNATQAVVDLPRSCEGQSNECSNGASSPRQRSSNESGLEWASS